MMKQKPSPKILNCYTLLEFSAVAVVVVSLAIFTIHCQNATSKKIN